MGELFYTLEGVVNVIIPLFIKALNVSVKMRSYNAHLCVQLRATGPISFQTSVLRQTRILARLNTRGSWIGHWIHLSHSQSPLITVSLTQLF
jgi:hypothetical protein